MSARFIPAACLIAAFAASAAAAQPWPAKPIRIIVAGAPGTPADVATRSVSDAVGQRLGQPVVVENRAGAQGVIGMDAVAKAEPDGYTLGLATLQMAAVQSMRKTMPFDLVKDLVPVVQLTNESPVLVVRDGLPVKTLAEFVAYAKARPDTLTYGTPGPGSPAHLGIELLSRSQGVRLRHVPYKSIAAAMTDLAGGQIDAALAGSAAALTGISSGRVRALAVSSPKRLAALPQVPTLAEAGLADVDLRGWTGVVAPAGTPAAVVTRLNAAFVEALAAPKTATQLTSQGAEPAGGTAGAFGELIVRESKRWQRVVQEAGITAD